MTDTTATLRKQLRDALKPLLPADYVLRPNALKLETITKPTLQLKQLAMEPAAEAAAGHLSVEFILTLASPITSPQAAEDALDDDVVVLTTALDRVPFCNWTRAEKVVTGPDDKYLAYDITLTVRTTPTPEATP